MNIKLIRSLTLCIIFTSNKIKELLSKTKGKNYFNKETFTSINNPFYNLWGVTSDCINFIFIFCINFQNKSYKYDTSKSSYDGCITFECVYSKEQLILPFLYKELMNEEQVSFD